MRHPESLNKRLGHSFETVLRMPTEEANYVLLQVVHRLPGGTYEQKDRIILIFNSLIVRDEMLAAAMKFSKRFRLQCGSRCPSICKRTPLKASQPASVNASL
jgi:hypothetical protein